MPKENKQKQSAKETNLRTRREYPKELKEFALALCKHVVGTDAGDDYRCQHKARIALAKAGHMEATSKRLLDGVASYINAQPEGLRGGCEVKAITVNAWCRAWNAKVQGAPVDKIENPDENFLAEIRIPTNSLPTSPEQEVAAVVLEQKRIDDALNFVREEFPI